MKENVKVNNACALAHINELSSKVPLARVAQNFWDSSLKPRLNAEVKLDGEIERNQDLFHREICGQCVPSLLST